MPYTKQIIFLKSISSPKFMGPGGIEPAAQNNILSCSMNNDLGNPQV